MPHPVGSPLLRLLDGIKVTKPPLFIAFEHRVDDAFPGPDHEAKLAVTRCVHKPEGVGSMWIGHQDRYRFVSFPVK